MGFRQSRSKRVLVLLAALALCLVAAAGAYAQPLNVVYVRNVDTGMSRAYCPLPMTLVSGGGFVETPPPAAGYKEEKLRQSHPISAKTGTVANGIPAIGWQAASSDFTDSVVAFAVCGLPSAAANIGGIQYVGAQGTGIARAYCPANTTVVGGGGFVE